MIEVRRVRVDEHAAVGDLTVAAYDGAGQVSDDYRRSLRDVAGRSDEESQVLVAVEDGAVLGSVTMVSACSEHFEHGRHGDGGFRMLAVAPHAQGRGVGHVLLATVVEHARAAEWRRLTITTMAWMAAAQAMYEEAGLVRRPDLDVRFASGIGLCYQLDLIPDAGRHFPTPGPVPEDPPLFVQQEDRPPGC